MTKPILLVLAATGCGISLPDDGPVEESTRAGSGNRVDANARWGIFSAFCDELVVENNEASRSGTEHGIYISFNDGASWQSLKLNLPVTPVHGIVVEDRDLVIGTHGRGFYVLDNIGVLRQATPELTTSDLFVFQTFDPLRGRDRCFVDIEAPEPAFRKRLRHQDGRMTVTAAVAGWVSGGQPNRFGSPSHRRVAIFATA